VCAIIIAGSHEVLNANTTVVAVGVVRETTQTLVVRNFTTDGAFTVRVGDQTITGFEADVWLERISRN